MGIIVAAEFLGAKAKDVTMDIQYLEDGANLMSAPVLSSEILAAELTILNRIQFDLLCFFFSVKHVVQGCPFMTSPIERMKDSHNVFLNIVYLATRRHAMATSCDFSN